MHKHVGVSLGFDSSVGHQTSMTTKNNRLMYRSLPVVPSTEQHSVEAANCRWCRWEGWRPFGFADSIRRCFHPTQTFRLPPNVGATYNIGLCNDWNRRGECSSYAPSLLTQLLRKQTAPPKNNELPESSDCDHCRWRGPILPDEDRQQWCLHPLQCHESPQWSHWIMGLCEEWNRTGSCARYEPQDLGRHPAMKDAAIDTQRCH